MKLKNYTVFFYFLSNPTNRKHLYLKNLTNNKAAMSIINHISCGFAKLEFEEAEIIVGLVVTSSTEEVKLLSRYRFIFSQVLNREVQMKI